MSGATSVVDSLVKEYLAFRGFATALKHFDADAKAEKTAALRVDKLVEQMCGMISAYDLPGLTELWAHLNSTVLLGLTKVQSDYADKLEEDVLKLYLANALHNKRQDKAQEMLKQLGPRLHNQPSWKDWFPILFVPSPEELPEFRPYFSKPWQDAFLTSLHNFLALAFHQMDVPRLLAYVGRPTSLANDTSSTTLSKSLLRHRAPPPDIVASAEVMDDFSVIAAGGEATAEKAASKSLKSVFKRRFSKAK